MHTKLPCFNEPTKLPPQPMTYQCPVPTALIPFLRDKKVKFYETNLVHKIINIVIIEITINDGWDLTSIIYAAWAHGMDDQFHSAKRYYPSNRSLIKKEAAI